MQRNTNQADVIRLRMAGLLVGLDSCISSAAKAAAQIRHYLTRIDHHIALQQEVHDQTQTEMLQENVANDIGTPEEVVTLPADLFEDMFWDSSLPNLNQSGLFQRQPFTS